MEKTAIASHTVREGLAGAAQSAGNGAPFIRLHRRIAHSQHAFSAEDGRTAAGRGGRSSDDKTGP
jgi:hypothetical protein